MRFLEGCNMSKSDFELSQKRLFDRFYDELLEKLMLFVEYLVDDEDDEAYEVRGAIVGYIIDTYTQSFYSEVKFILEALDIPVTQQELTVIQNSVDTSAFAISNRGRLNSILVSYQGDIKKRKMEEGDSFDREAVITEFVSSLVRLSTSEIHMSVEKASVQGAKLLQSTLGVRLNKTWHCTGDERSCKTCLDLDGTTVPVDEPFVTSFTDDYKTLSYTGGDTTYAHPRCRCWTTYSTA